MASEPDPESLLDEARWLERIARGLVGDEHAARDLVQEAWLAAEVGAPRIRGARRAWLVGTVRKLAAKAFRSRRRADRRLAALRPEGAAPSAAELTARAEQHERLLAHLRALPEHERVPLLMRYYEDLPPRTIAERLGAPVRTVHTRLARALEALRARLDAEHPRGRAGWLGALLMISDARPVAPDASPLAGTPLASPGAPRTLAWLAASLVAATTLVVAWSADRSAGAPDVATASPPAAVPDEEARRVQRTTTAPTPAAEAQPWTGSVVDWNGRPVAGAAVSVATHRGLRWDVGSGDDVELVAGPSTRLAEPTAGDGTFRGPRPTEASEVRASAPGHLTALVAIWRPERSLEPTVVLAPARPFQGRVFGDEGNALAGASVCVRLPSEVGGPTQHGNEGLHALHWRTTTDASGAFTLSAIPAVDEAQLEVTHEGHHALVARVTACDPTRLVLRRWEHTTTGVLVDPAGTPLADAVIATSTHFATSRADGSFTLQAAPGEALRGAARGFAPSTLPLAGTTRSYVLATAAQTLEGTLLGTDGLPRTGHEITLLDATVVGDSKDVRVLESVAVGAHSLVHPSVTDANGRFRISGLAPREYRLRVQDPRTAAWFATPPSAPGRPHRIVVPDDLVVARARFRLLAAAGAPLVGATITVQGPAFEAKAPGAEHGPLVYAVGTSGTTDAAGVVELENVPRSGAWLRIAHREIGIVQRDFDPTPGAERVLELTRVGQLGVRLAAPRGDEWIEILDAAGHPLELACITGISRRPARRWPLVGGTSPLLETPESARWLCIGSPRGELGRHAVTVLPGRRVHLDF